MAAVPKLIRRTKGVFGAVLAEAGTSSSSIAFSSMESELVDMLPRRILKVGGLVGDVPERPMVVTDKRRRWGSKLFIWPLLPFELLDGPRWKRLERAAWVIELRRGFTPLEELSEDIVGSTEAVLFA